MEKNEQTTVKRIHRPVMLARVLQQIKDHVGNSSIIVDCTMGDGGHSSEILKEFVGDNSDRVLLSIDWDDESYKFVSEFYDKKPLDITNSSTKTNEKWMYVQTNFAHIDTALQKVGKVTGRTPLAAAMLFDLGISSRQIAQKQRGFSFMGNGALDMRMDRENYTVTAAMLLNMLSVNKLTDLFNKTVGMRKQVAHELAKEIAIERDRKPFGADNDVRRVNEIAEKVQPIRTSAMGRLHPSTLLFLALRIAVNTELMNLYEVLPLAKRNLTDRGVLLVMTYHSAEEKIVEEFVKKSHSHVTVFLASKNEIAGNPRARSAKLFVIQ